MNPWIGIKRSFTCALFTSGLAAPANPGAGLTGGRTLKSAVLAGLFLTAIPPAQAINIWINEIHYDNTGADTGEFVEIAGEAGASLSGFSLVLYNGTGGAPYATIALSGTIGNLQNGFGTLSFAAVGLQNGAPDGLALVDSSSAVIQFLSYEGVFTAAGGAANGMLSTDIVVVEIGTEPVGWSLQLTGTGDSYEDFAWMRPSSETKGAINTGQAFPVSVPDAGSSLALLGLALGGLGFIARFRRS
jgi:hypothetical protein